VPTLTDLRDRLRLVVGFEAAALQRLGLPLPIVYAIYAALAVAGAVWPFARAVPVGPSLANIWDPVYAYLFVESLPFLAVAMAVGLLGRSFGLAFVLPFVVADWLVFQFGGTISGGSAVFHSAGAYLGRLVLLVLLCALVFMFPALPRTAVGLGRRRGPLWAAVGAGIGGVAYGALVLAWAVAVPYLVRPIFNNDFVPYGAIGDVQEYRDVIAFIGAVLALVAGLVLYPRTSPILDGIALAPWASWTRRLAPLAPVIVPAVLLVMFMGIVTTWLDAAVLIAGGVAGPLLAPVVRRLPPFRWLLEHVWLPLRLLLGVGVATAIAVAVTVVHYGPALGSEFFIMVLTVAISVPLVTWLGGTDLRPRQDSATPVAGSAGVVASAVALAALLAVLGLVLAGPVLGDNCSGFFDCAYGKLSEWAAAVIAFLAAAWAAFWFGLKTVVIHPLIPEPFVSEEAVEAIRGGQSMWQKKVADQVGMNGDMDEMKRIRDLSPAEFIREAQSGKWDALFGPGGSGGGGGGGMSIGGSAGCLPGGTMIDTPSGARAVEHLAAGDMVVTIDAGGARAIAPLRAVASQWVPLWHVLVRLDLEDGRSVRASARHPLIDGRLLGDVVTGDLVDGVPVKRARALAYRERVTYDILADSPTGAYLVGGIPLGSTIPAPTTVISRGNAVRRASRRASASKTTRSSIRTPVRPSR
jgi:hypothetical protein